MRHPIALVFALAAVLTAARLDAQPGSIVVNPDAVKLKLFWAMEGAEHGSEFGASFCSVPDIDGDGRDEVVIGSFNPRELRLFRGDSIGLRRDAFWRYDSAHVWPGSATPGRFVGGVQRFLPVVAGQRDLHLLKIDSGRIATTPSMVWRGRRSDRPERRAYLGDYTVADLDGDGADELICFISFVEGEPAPNHPQVWIYRGGVDFQLDVPDAVLIDQAAFDGYAPMAAVGDLDGDHAADIAMLNRRTGRPTAMSIWFGSGSVPICGQTADRTLEVSFTQFRTADVDGDSVLDAIGNRWIFRSGAGKSVRARSFGVDDADAVIADAPRITQIFGPLNNRSRRFDMVGVLSYDVVDGGQLQAFSGSPIGPDGRVDAVFYESDHGFLGSVSSIINGPAGDVNGDGWSDFLCGDPLYYDPGIDKGIVVILAGGPYIPVDDPSMGVREIVTGERPRALFVWPNPVRDHLNIAWRGDLRRSPSRFEIVDARGVTIATGEVGPDAGAAIWRCGDVAAGTYLLRVLDSQGESIGVASIRKE